jgi:membrane protease subunit (stomatin/prohibitin family)
MGLIRAFTGALSGTFADQWKEIVTSQQFDEHDLVVPGVLQITNNGRGVNTKGSEDVLSNGSKIFVPENTAAFIFSQSGIEEIITESGGYEYQSGIASIFNGDGIKESFFSEIGDRVGYGGQTDKKVKIAFLNLREIRNLKFGTRGPVVYYDGFYGTDLEIRSFGAYSVKVIDPALFIRNFVPANTTYYSFDSDVAKGQISSEFLQSFTSILNGMSATYRISQLPGQTTEIAKLIAADDYNAGTWPERFGLQLIRVGIESIEFTPESRELVKKFSESKMTTKFYEGITQEASNMSAQQKIAEGLQNHGFGDVGGMIMGMNMANTVGRQAQKVVMPVQSHSTDSESVQSKESEAPRNTETPVQNQSSNEKIIKSDSEDEPELTFDEQISMLKQLKELVDAGILTEEEFNAKKIQIMGL